MNDSALPSGFLGRMRTQLGKEAFGKFEEAMAGDPVISLRGNPHKPVVLSGEPVPWHPWGRYLTERPSFTADPLFHAGAYYVQEASSMLLHQLMDWTEPMRILDLCAAPGGKSTLLAGAMASGSLLVANEVMPNRASVLAENLTRWGHPDVIVTQNDPRDFQALPDFFDLALVDAPCSGEGMFRKDPVAVAEWSEDNVAQCALRQRRILADIAGSIRPGGYLIYSTCTWSEDEDEELIRGLLAELGGEYELAPVTLPPAFGAEAVAIEGTPNAAYRCYPHLIRGEGLFFCRLRRKGEGRGVRYEMPGKKEKKRAGNAGQDLLRWVSPWVRDAKSFQWEEHNGKVFGFSEPVAAALPHLKGRLRMLKKGLMAGTLYRQGMNPSHELVLCHCLSPSVPKVELDLETARVFLKKEEVSLPEVQKKGWVVATFQGIALGWLKATGAGWKNYFPVNWRIRSETW